MRVGRRSRVAGMVIVVLLACMALLPTALGGATSYVITRGDSMAPRFHAGDLAVLRTADEYRVGQVVAYHSTELDTTVMHRIVAIQDARYTFKGDNNDFLDPDQPTEDQLIGTLAIHIPQGGVWLRRATSPPVLALVTFALLAGGGRAASTRRNRRRTTMTRRNTDTAHRGPSAAAPTPLRNAAALTATAGALALGLGVLAWTVPAEKTTQVSDPTARTMTFDYSAKVPATAAYDDTTVRAPDPVFRKLTNTVDIQFAYHGDPGTMTVTADVSTPSGWHTTLPLRDATTVTTPDYTGTARLNLKAIEARAAAAATAAGLPREDLTVAVTPQVTTQTGDTFSPTLKLTLTPLKMTLLEENLTVNDPTAKRTVEAPRTVALLGRHLPLATARIAAVLLGALGLLAAAALTIAARRDRGAPDATAIRKRYAALLIPVHPAPTAPGQPVIDVTEFPTLARIAQRYNTHILHWTRNGIDTFILHDDGTTYRYRTGEHTLPTQPHPEPAPTDGTRH